MLNSLSLSDLAFYLARLIYRDTEIENYHAIKALMDMELFDEIYKIVDKNVKMVIHCHGILAKVQNEQDIDDEMRRMSPFLREEFQRYVIAFWYLSKCKCDWDPPEKLILSSKPEDLSKYILEGHFLECCKEHRTLCNQTMYYINKDVYNRIYTLLCENFLS